jgi:predicted kinase
MLNQPFGIPEATGDLPRLAIVCGLPATGKSTLARQLRDALGWPAFSKDNFKEALFDGRNLEPTTLTRDQSKAIGGEALTMLFQVTRQTLEAGQPCIVEANFLPQLAPMDFGPLTPLADLRQVHCVAPTSLVLARYRARAEAGKRHPVHTDAEAFAELQNRIDAGGGEPLSIAGELLQVDTTDGLQPNLAEILTFLTR